MSNGVRVLAFLVAVTTLSFAPAGGGGLKRLTLGTDTITGGYALSGIVETFPCSANQEYSTLTVTSSMPSVASVESPVYVECGFPNTADFGITTHAVTSPRSVTISVTKGTIVREQQLTVTPYPHLVSLTVQQPAYYGLPTYATLQLDSPAPPGGLSVTVNSNDPYVNPPWHGAFSYPVENRCAIASEYSSIAAIPTGQTACSFPVDILTANFTPSSVTLSANAGAATVQSTFNPLAPAPNLFIRKIELTQAIQYLDDPDPLFVDNSLPLIKAKPLAVRVFVNSEGTGQEYDGVPVSLWTRRSSHEDWKVQSNRVSQPMRVTPVITNEKERSNWASDVTYNNVTFIIDPWDFILGTLDIRAEVNPIQPLGTNPVAGVNSSVPAGTRVVNEVNYADNTSELTGIVFHATHSLKVKFVKIDWHPNPFKGTKRPSWSVLDRIVPYLEMVYPVERVDYSKASKEVNIGVFEAAIGAADFNHRWAWEYVLDKLDVFETFTDSQSSTKYFALLDEGVSHHSIAGLAETSGSQRSAAGHTGEHTGQGGILDEGSTTAAQEIGHLFDRGHAPCGNPSSQDDNWPDSTNPGAIIGHTGFDVVEPQPLKGDYFTDFMSYCWPNWISPYTYCALYRRFVSDASTCAAPNLAATPVIEQPLARLGKGSAYVALRGVIGEHKAILLPSYVKATASHTADERGHGPYSLVLLDGGGKSLFRRDFAASDSTGPGGAFLEFVPLLKGVARVELREGPTLLAKRLVSPSAPTVKLLAPKGGELFDDLSKPLQVRWKGSDPDGDKLRYMLLFSRDDGRQWEVVIADDDQSSAEIDLTELPGSDHAKFRIVASDGFHVAEDESSTIVVARKPPEVTIVAPSMTNVRSPVVLRGMAYDSEDGSLPDQAMSWVSDRDGALGKGRYVVAALSEGTHVLTLRAEDEDKQSSEAKVTVKVSVASERRIP